MLTLPKLDIERKAHNAIDGDYCATPGCKKLRYPIRNGRLKYCCAHSVKKNRWGPVRYARIKKLFGKTWINNNGYRMIFFCGRATLVHRLIDVITNGPLLPTWDVHHKDDNKLHNHWRNLQRLPHGVHTSLHNRIAC